MGRKHCGKRRNCLLRAISPFPTVFNRLVSQGHHKVYLCGNGLMGKMLNMEYWNTGIFGNCIDPFPNKPWFLHVCSTSLLKTPWEKEKLLVTSNFSFSHSVFYPFEEVSAIFIKSEIVVC